MSNDQLRLAVLNLVAAEVQRSRSLHSLVDAKIHGDMRKIRADVMSDFITFVENYNFISNPVQFGYSVGLFVNQEKSS
jgi:hypothetical protein